MTNSGTEVCETTSRDLGNTVRMLHSQCQKAN